MDQCSSQLPGTETLENLCTKAAVKSEKEPANIQPSLITGSLEEALKFIKNHEQEHNLKFATHFSEKGFGATDFTRRKHVVKWTKDHLPYMIVNQKNYDCQHGIDRNQRKKERKREWRLSHQDEPIRKKKLDYSTKKMNCPAVIRIRELIEFPSHQYEESTAWKRSKEVKIIKDDLENKKKISDYRRKFHVFLPDISTHIGHSVSVGGQVVEKVVEEIIEEHVEETNHNQRGGLMAAKLLSQYFSNNLERTWDYVNIHDSVAVLMFNTSRMAFILVRQFRPALYMYINNEINGKERTQITEDNCEISITAPPQVGVSYELCAGIVDKKMSLEEIAKCEVMEETGYDISSVQLELIMKSRSVGTAGNSQTIYFAEVTDDMNTGQGGGNPDENEQIELEYIPLSEAKHFVFDGSKSKPSSLVAAFMWYFWKNKIP